MHLACGVDIQKGTFNMTLSNKSIMDLILNYVQNMAHACAVHVFSFIKKALVPLA